MIGINHLGLSVNCLEIVTYWITFTYNIKYMSANKLQPEYLKPGDKAAIISPSFCIDESKLNGAVSFLETW